MAPTDPDRPLTALLSQVLVALTIELDGEFERRMRDSGYPGGRLSHVVWANIFRHMGGAECCVRDLAARSHIGAEAVRFRLGCIERWGFITLEADPTDARPVQTSVHRRAHRELRDGWGSGRGIRSSWIIRLTQRGERAVEIWQALPPEIEGRWRARFGADVVAALRHSATTLADLVQEDLPWGVALQMDPIAPGPFPARSGPLPAGLPLPYVLALPLQAMALEFQSNGPAPLAICANVLRVLGAGPVATRELGTLTGCSREAADIGWMLKPFVAVEKPRNGWRGPVALLTPRGAAARDAYLPLLGEIEDRMRREGGQVDALRSCLARLFYIDESGRQRIAEGLVPPAGNVRAGNLTPGLGRLTPGVADQRRFRDLVAQTRAFVADPAAALPHYPLWDMNRGFGP